MDTKYGYNTIWEANTSKLNNSGCGQIMEMASIQTPETYNKLIIPTTVK